jgi:ABC-2 type transport system ATP-binding protein
VTLSPDREVLLSAAGLRKRFGTTEALSGLSFELHAGEVLGLLGPNGAGKTTTLKLLLGMLRPDAGQATVLGLDCTREAREVKGRLGYSPDEPAFYDFLTGRETLDFAANIRGTDLTEMWTGLAPLIAALDFEPQLGQYTAGYSHGMKKKLALLLALAHRPRVLLLDEPTNGLDPPMAAKVRELLRQRASEGCGVLVSTHLLDMADRLCERALVLHKGRLLAEGAPAALRQRAGLPPEATLEDAFLKLVA